MIRCELNKIGVVGMNSRNDQEVRLTGCGGSGEEPVVILRFLAWVMSEWWYHSAGMGSIGEGAGLGMGGK